MKSIEGRKIYEKIVKKLLVKLPRDVKQMVLIVGGAWIPGFIVEGRKLDFLR